MSDDLISRPAAIDTVMECYDNDELFEVYEWKLNELPAIQPEIVRCGECKWFQCNMRLDGYLPQGVDEFECRHWCGSCDPTDFCSQGTRREVTT